MDHLQHCAELEVEVARFADVLALCDPFAQVPTCPAWNVHDLALHLGTIHRWAEYLVRERSPVRVSPFDFRPEGDSPDAAWIRDGGFQLVTTLRECDPDEAMWAWGADQHARFWSRRQLHETLVHRVDLELAQGITPRLEPMIAADGVDEFLINLPNSARFSPGVKNLTGGGERIGFTQSDGDRRWIATLDEGGVSLSNSEGPLDLELRATAANLLLVLYRRSGFDDENISLTGREDLLQFWFAHSALG